MKRYTPMKAIGKHCFECSGWSFKDREECEFTDCPLYLYRFGKKPAEKPEYTPVKAIRQFCLECTMGVYKERELCPAGECYIYPYRMGKNPNYSHKENETVKNGSVK